MARLLRVTRPGYYSWSARKPSKTKLRHAFLKEEITRVFKEHKGRYGSPRIALQLYDEGIETNKRVVAKLMQELNLCAVGYHKRKESYGQNKSIEDVISENILNREFDQDVIDAVWVTDITYITCTDGRLYLSTFIDLATRIPRAFKVHSDMKKHIVIDPIEKYRWKLPDVIHSDRGSQYRSYAFRDLLEANGIIHSMSEPGTPVDNAVIESFHRSIKRELINPNKNKTKAEMKVLIHDYLTNYYVNHRIHTKFQKTLKQHEEEIRVSLNFV
jgi:putative transposase